MTDPLLELRDLRVWFPIGDGLFRAKRNLRAVDGIDLRVAPGEALGIVGESGCGKSTLARLLYRFYDVGGGRIAINGVDIRDLKQTGLRGAIGIVPQDSVIFSTSALENIRYGRPQASEEEVVAAAKAAAWAAWAASTA